VRQTKYLFLGGPLDQQWREVPRADALVVAVECAAGPTTARMVHYHRHRILAPGWLAPITVFTTDPLRVPKVGASMPGWIEGGRSDCRPIAPLNWTGPARHARALHAAIKARGFRP